MRTPSRAAQLETGAQPRNAEERERRAEGLVN